MHFSARFILTIYLEIEWLVYVVIVTSLTETRIMWLYYCCSSWCSFCTFRRRVMLQRVLAPVRNERKWNGNHPQLSGNVAAVMQCSGESLHLIFINFIPLLLKIHICALTLRCGRPMSYNSPLHATPKRSMVSMKKNLGWLYRSVNAPLLWTRKWVQKGYLESGMA